MDNPQDFAPRETFPPNEVAQDILENGFRNFDYSEWKTLEDKDKAEAFDNLIGLIAGFKLDASLTYIENKSERLSEIKDSLENTIKFWAEREIRNSYKNGLEKG